MMNIEFFMSLSKSKSVKIAILFYCGLSIIATLTIKFITYLMGANELLPLAKSLFLGIIVAIPFSAYFGSKIIRLQPPNRIKAFGLGVLLVLVALPFYDLGLLYIFQEVHPDLYDAGTDFSHLLLLYGLIFIYSLLLSGIWLAILCGLASIYLREKIIPKFDKSS